MISILNCFIKLIKGTPAAPEKPCILIRPHVQIQRVYIYIYLKKKKKGHPPVKSIYIKAPCKIIRSRGLSFYSGSYKTP